MIASFIDELVKLGAGTLMVKRAYEVNTVDIPHGMMSQDPSPPADRVNPADATTRLPNTGHAMSHVPTGHLGGVTESKHPIDRFKYNRLYRDRR